MCKSEELLLMEYRQLARKMLKDRRYEHTLAVARLSGELAEHYGVNPFRARSAGLLHDITKELPAADQLQMLEKSGILYDKTLLAIPNIHHALTAAYYARTELFLEDDEILSAIRYHATGRAGMSILEKIVFTADSVSYDRSYPEVEKLRKLAFQNLDAAILELVVFAMKKLMKARLIIAPDAIGCYNQMCEKGLPEARGGA